MPGFRGHLIGGTLTYLAILQCIKSMQPSLPVIASGFVFCIVGSLFPDIDIKSKGQKLFYSLGLIILCCFLYYERTDLFIGLSLLATVPLLVKHRGIFHELWFLIFISISTGLVIGSFHAQYSAWAMKNALFFLAGAISHIVLDRVITRLKYWLIVK
ncbi:metal-dependent hydrolase [Candidatus Babeliales bacterium]|nr:metal-dependent hydrolase [Candidatus Babeliales bacterium]MBP9843559.1 metal-dependent hydrolase [Candidatus Babeliales bacterium]